MGGSRDKAHELKTVSFRCHVLGCDEMGWGVEGCTWRGVSATMGDVVPRMYDVGLCEIVACFGD